MILMNPKRSARSSRDIAWCLQYDDVDEVREMFARCSMNPKNSDEVRE